MNIMFQVGSWHYDKGGTDLFVKTISYWLAKRGHTVIVLAHRLIEEDCENEDIRFGNGIIKVRYTPKQRRGVRFNPFVYAYRLMITSMYLYKIAKQEKAEVIVVGETELLSVLSLKLTKTKIICRGGALLYETMGREVIKEIGNGFYSKLFIALIKLYNDLTLKLPDAMVPVNKEEYDFLNKKKKRNAIITTIPHGIPINLFKPIKKRKKEALTIGYVGRLAPIKYPEVVLEIFKKASLNSGIKTNFVWIGPLDPSYEEDFFEKIKEKMKIKNAEYLGQVKNDKLPKYLQKMDVFLQAEQQTNVSRSTTEAAACGIPIVALNEGSEPYGFFTKSKEKAINELKKVITNKKYREEQSRKAREIIFKNYSEDKMYEQYLNLFKELK